MGEIGKAKCMKKILKICVIIYHFCVKSYPYLCSRPKKTLTKDCGNRIIIITGEPVKSPRSEVLKPV